MRHTVADAIKILETLTPAERQRFLRKLRDKGILGRRPRGERKAERNERIRAQHARGLTPGQIAGLEGMSRDAVRKVLRRNNSAGYVGKTSPLKIAAVT